MSKLAIEINRHSEGGLSTVLEGAVAIFCGSIIAAGSLSPSMASVAEVVRAESCEFEAEDLSLLVSGSRDKFLDRRTTKDVYTPDAFEILENLARALSKRGGRIAAVIAYLTICDQLKNGGTGFVVALDSTQYAKKVVYREAMDKEFETLAQGRARLELLQSVNQVSVPNCGGLYTLHDFL